MSIEAK